MGRTIGVAVAMMLAVSAASAGNLLQNADFSQKTDAGLPASWTVGKGQKVVAAATDVPPGVGQSLRVDVVADGGTSYGEVGQVIKVKPNTIYRLEGSLKSTKAGMAFFSIKLRKDRQEIKRIGLTKSGTKWTPTSNEFSSEGADEIQVLCRWEENAARGWVGQTSWFANVSLVEVGAAPPPPAWVTAQQQAAKVTPVAAPELPLKARDADIYVTPSGAGKTDGTGWENALPGNAPGVLQAAWDALAPGRACHLGSGVYAQAALTISSGGSGPTKMKRLVGDDTGGGLPWLVGDWNPNDPGKGLTCLNLANEVDYCALENLQLTRYQFGVFSRKGGHIGLRITNLDAYETRHGVYLCGFAYADAPDAASHDIEIRDCEFVHFTKSAVRLQGGNYDVRLINCLADAGGAEWMKESFQICYAVQGDAPRRLFKKDDKPWASEHDIIFINCVARNAYYSKAKFWQGDGWTAERGVHNIAFINCESHDNADGGWDIKADNVIFINCISVRNKMNWRLRLPTFMYNCLSVFSFKRGGSWISTGLWATGEIHIDHSTFHNNSTQQLAPDKGEDKEGRVLLDHCIVSFDGSIPEVERLYSAESRVQKSETAEWSPKTDKAEAVGADPQYVAAGNKAWDGRPPDAFDSRLYGPSKGFHSSVYAAWRKMPVEKLVETARLLLKHKDWDDLRANVKAATGKTAQ